MDWMKLEILIAVRNSIATRTGSPFICNTMKEEFLSIYHTNLNEEELKGFFHEFFALFDGKFWGKEMSVPITYGDAWWYTPNTKVRLEILDFIIANRSM